LRDFKKSLGSVELSKVLEREDFDEQDGGPKDNELQGIK